MIKEFKNNLSILIIFFLGIVYFFFLSNNPTPDSYSNAFSSITKDNLFSPHHLIYNPFFYAIYFLFHNINIEPIKVFQSVNAVFAIGCLIIIRHMLKENQIKESLIITTLLFLGSCFGFIRFATDNECYILPLFFSLLAINYVRLFLIKNTMKRAIILSLLCVMSCLFHQIGIFTLISVFIVLIFKGTKPQIIAFLITILLIPATYLIALYFEQNTLSLDALISFVLKDYVSNQAEMPILKNIFILTPISTFRSFIQIHGYILSLIRLYPLITIPIIIICLFLFLRFFILLPKLRRRKIYLYQDKNFLKFLYLMTGLHFLFAVFSNANAEFMVILPFLLVLILVYNYNEIIKPLLYISLGLFIWNFTFALFPYSKIKISTNQDIAFFVQKNPLDIFVFKEKREIENILAYRLKTQKLYNIYNIDEVKSEDFLNWEKQGKIIHTDCFGGKETISRATISISNNRNIESNNPIIKNKNHFFKTYNYISLSRETEIWSFISNFAP